VRALSSSTLNTVEIVFIRFIPELFYYSMQSGTIRSQSRWTPGKAGAAGASMDSSSIDDHNLTKKKLHTLLNWRSRSP